MKTLINDAKDWIDWIGLQKEEMEMTDPEFDGFSLGYAMVSETDLDDLQLFMEGLLKCIGSK